MKVPTTKQCQELFEHYQVPGTVRQHCQAVQATAVFLAKELALKGYALDLEIISPFSLLHDLMKAVVLDKLDGPPYHYHPTPKEVAMHQQLRKQYPQMSETKVAYLVLKEKYPEFAQLFLELDQFIYNPSAPVHEETRFIHYIDWRVLGNKVVPLSERLEYILNRYGRWFEKNNINWEETVQEQQKFERKIFNYLPFEPQELAKQVSLLS